MDLRSPTVESIAQRLDAAWRTRTAIAPITETDGVSDAKTAYGIQKHWTDMRVARGDKIVGRKIGLTSKVVQEQIGVSEPDYGALWQSSFYEARNGKVTIPAKDFLQPRIEGEVAFLIGRRLEGPDISPEDVLAATEACALGVEIVDSRIADWKIKFFDTVADNASYGGFSLGPWDKKLRDSDLSAVRMSVVQDGSLATEGLGSAVWGSPVITTAWLVNKLWELGVSLEPGDVVISGAFMKMLSMTSGNEFIFSLTGQPDLTVTVT